MTLLVNRMLIIGTDATQLRTTVLPQTQDTTATALATPFLPGISGGIWSPPSWATPPPAPEKKEEDVSGPPLHRADCVL